MNMVCGVGLERTYVLSIRIKILEPTNGADKVCNLMVLEPPGGLVLETQHRLKRAFRWPKTLCKVFDVFDVFPPSHIATTIKLDHDK
jgi:hypothetical protein